MKILVIGSGGREHTLVWKIAQSADVDRLYAAPGNPGMAQLAECVDIQADDTDGLLVFALRERIDLTVVGPEVPLALGIVDRFEERGLKIFGPSGRAAQIESSKGFSKDLMAKYGIPTARYQRFTFSEEAVRYVREQGAPIVVKADGLAAGKGVLICRTQAEAVEAVRTIMEDQAFGAAGKEVVVEEFLEGEEASILALTDGETILPLVASQDHKAIFDGDRGPNTGGMGAYAPAPVVTEAVAQRVMEQVLRPAVDGMAKEGRIYKGVLYAGLMIADGKLKVVEFNCRFGDPESQVVLPLLKTDLVALMMAVAEGRLGEMSLEESDASAVCVVMASEGYPGSYEKGKRITGLDTAREMDDVVVFHAGTGVRDGNIVTNGGRVLGVTAMGADIGRAIDRAYEAVGKINFEGAYYRRDIGAKALTRL
ncbi:MAG: phosphoribosylamine--glycine ligase [Candidatus Latescibacteria bacterium 4484_107]|nr:MAG: phosphoribosylamine--glycine ligase [Candidatus Latescibacteria bacterium 4484_107]